MISSSGAPGATPTRPPSTSSPESSNSRSRLSSGRSGRRLAGVAFSYDVAAMTRAVEAKDHGFDALFAAHYHRLARAIYRVIGDTGHAEELASEAFWRLHRNPPAFERNLAGWLYRTGLRLALDRLKMQKRRAFYEG